MSHELDSIRAREAWFRLKLLWSNGSCLSFHGIDRGRPYNASEWPECGPALSRMRAEVVGCQQGVTPVVSILTFELRRALMVASTRDDSPLANWLDDPLGREEACALKGNASLRSACDAECELFLAECARLEDLATGAPCVAWNAFDWEGDDCALQGLLLGERCPAVPDHMRNLSASIGREKEGWQDRPSTCLTEAELWFAANGSWVISSGLALIVLAIINARRISKVSLYPEPLP